MFIDEIFGGYEMLGSEEEKELILKYQGGDKEAGNIVMESRMFWISNVVKGLGLPNWVDLDEVTVDVSSDIAIALLNYDPEVASVSTYVYQIILRQSRNSVKNQTQQFKEIEGWDGVPAPEDSDPTSVIDDIRRVMRKADLNDESRLLLDRMLKGTSVPEIGRQLRWKRGEVEEAMREMRKKIAFCLVSNGLSAAPWLSDRDLKRLAAQYQGKDWLA